MIQVDNENPNEHWKFIDVQDRTVLDLGCGRWEQVEYRDPQWPTTPEYFIQKGANSVIGVDSDHREVNWFNTQYQDENKYSFIHALIKSPQDIKSLFNKYSPDCVKCDIEGYESNLFSLDNDIFRSIKEYYIETHGGLLYQQCLQKFNECGYEVHEQIDLTHTKGYCKVIFARLNEDSDNRG